MHVDIDFFIIRIIRMARHENKFELTSSKQFLSTNGSQNWLV